MTYTSGYHFVIRFGLAFGGLFASILPGWLAAQVAFLFHMPKDYEVIPFLLGMASFLVPYVLLMDKYQYFTDAIAAYMYVRTDLETPITFSEAKELSFLFAGDQNRKWYPLSEVANLPKDKRKQYLFQVASEIRRTSRPTFSSRDVR